MLRVWQKRLLNNILTIRHELKSGTHQIELPSGIYEITLIGCGGATNVEYSIPIHDTYSAFYAQGGVGGTTTARLYISADTTITAHVGDKNDKDSYITGIEGFTLRAGGGTDGIASSPSSGTAGVIGTNTMQGNFLSLISNENDIVSKTFSYQVKGGNEPSIPRVLNINYPDDTFRGSAYYWRKDEDIGVGLILIRSI